MTGGVFGTTYSDAYDILYAEKDYESECDIIERAIAVYARRPVRSILDLGCGTGNHALPLACRGYQVVGVDRSAPMLARARQKATQVSSRCLEFHCGDLKGFSAERPFDAVIIMFNVLGYQIEPDGALEALRNVHRNLAPGGIMVADFWYGEAVARSGAQQRHKVLSAGDSQIIRLTDSTIDPVRSICDVSFQLWQIKKRQLAAHTTELHSVRFFFSDELERLTRLADLTLERIGAFPAFEREPGAEGNWSAIAICSKREL